MLEIDKDAILREVQQLQQQLPPAGGKGKNSWRPTDRELLLLAHLWPTCRQAEVARVLNVTIDTARKYYGLLREGRVLLSDGTRVPMA